MKPAGSITLIIEDCLERIERGEAGAVDQLVDSAYERLVSVTERIVGCMVSSHTGLRASDVFQESYFRLRNALLKDNVKPKTAGEFMGLAARHIRFQVLDMLRASRRIAVEAVPDIATAPQATDNSEMWICFFAAFESLSGEERDVADLLWTWVDGKGGAAVPNMSQSEAADVLGMKRDRIKDLWRSAKLKISRKCKIFDLNEPPTTDH